MTHISSRLVRSLVLPLAGAALAVATAALPASAATVRPDSSGGGCSSSGGSPDVEACISASGSYLEPDAYIINNSGCVSAGWRLYDTTSGSNVLEQEVSMGCADGHYGPYGFAGIKGHSYRTLAYINTANITNFAESPTEYFS
ncbi:MAG: hypothetical protein HOY79_26195 [Streptomyces sp.]|nr:hypothetical protein [Streptomyces sp.]